MANNYDPVDLSYVAGIIDGEGTKGITELSPGGSRSDGRRVRKSVQHRVYIAVTMTDPIVPTMLHEMFGGYLQQLPQRQIQHKPTFRWSLSSDGAVDFCKIIGPYLKLKQAQSKLVIAFYEEHMGKKFQGPGGIPEDELSLRREKYEAAKVLNHRGLN